MARNVPITTEVKKVFKDTKIGKRSGENRITINLIMDTGETVTLKLTNLFNKYLHNGNTPVA